MAACLGVLCIIFSDGAMLTPGLGVLILVLGCGAMFLEEKRQREQKGEWYYLSVIKICMYVSTLKKKKKDKKNRIKKEKINLRIPYYNFHSDIDQLDNACNRLGRSGWCTDLQDSRSKKFDMNFRGNIDRYCIDGNYLQSKFLQTSDPAVLVRCTPIPIFVA